MMRLSNSVLLFCFSSLVLVQLSLAQSTTTSNSYITEFTRKQNDLIDKLKKLDELKKNSTSSSKDAKEELKKLKDELVFMVIRCQT